MNQQLEKTLAKFFCGEANTEEQKLVQKWKAANYSEFEKYRKAYALNIFYEQKFLPQKNVSEILLKAELQSAIASKNRYLMWLRIAAVFTGLLIVGVLLTEYNRTLSYSHTNLTTTTETMQMPDGSEIILSSNSSINYKLNWLGNFTREINLKGRAYFYIKKDVANPFSIHLEKIKITVLGTQFTVNETNEKTQVVLTEGMIRLQSDALETPVELNQPGSQVILNHQGIVKQNTVNASLYAAWKEEKLYFNNCTVDEIVNLLNDSYDVRLDLANQQMLNTKLLGSAPSDDPHLIIKALSHILQTELKVK